MDEMELMRQIFDKYAADVVFVSICADREYMKMYHFVREHKYPWVFLHLNSNYKLLEDYAVYAYPSFALIDGNGKFMKCPVIKPSDNIDLLFKELLSGKK
jgi:hypothetical protein